MDMGIRVSVRDGFRRGDNRVITVFLDIWVLAAANALDMEAYPLHKLRGRTREVSPQAQWSWVPRDADVCQEAKPDGSGVSPGVSVKVSQDSHLNTGRGSVVPWLS